MPNPGSEELFARVSATRRKCWLKTQKGSSHFRGSEIDSPLSRKRSASWRNSQAVGSPWIGFPFFDLSRSFLASRAAAAARVLVSPGGGTEN